MDQRAASAAAGEMTPTHEVHVALRTAQELVLIKPPGMSCELPNDARGASLIEQVRRGGVEGIQPCPDAKLPHRLDRVACGYVVVALTGRAIAHHNAEIAAGAWAKWYIARVAGDVRGLIGEHRAYIKRRGKQAELVRAGGQPALLDVLDVQDAPDRVGQSHVLIRLHTGRYHQIRAMLAGLGAPLVGDAMYGGPRGELYLEHAALRLVPMDSSDAGAITLFDANSPRREPIEPALIHALMRAISEVE